MSTFVTRFLKDESGATAIEYGLIATFIALAIIAAASALATKISSNFNNIGAKL